jgi:hypothetical protein
MNAAFSTLLETRDFDLEIEEATAVPRTKTEKFRMARQPKFDAVRPRPKKFNGIHRRRIKKVN